MSSQETTWAQPPSPSPSTGFRPQPSLTPNASSWSDVVDGNLAGESLSVQHMFLLLCQWLGEMGVKVSWEKALEVPTSAASYSCTPRRSPAPLIEGALSGIVFWVVCSPRLLVCSLGCVVVWYHFLVLLSVSRLGPGVFFSAGALSVFLCASTLVVDDTG